MSASTTTYSLRIDSEVKRKAEAIYAAMGQTLSSAINAFLLQSVRVGGFPFEMRLTEDQRETVLAMLEAEEIMADPEKYSFMDAEDLIEELKR